MFLFYGFRDSTAFRQAETHVGADFRTERVKLSEKYCVVRFETRVIVDLDVGVGVGVRGSMHCMHTNKVNYSASQ